MKALIGITLLSSTLLANQLLANIQTPYPYYINFAAALSYDNQFKHTTMVAPAGGLLAPQQLTTDDARHFTPEFGLEAGRTIFANTHWQAQLGLGFFVDPQKTLSGKYYSTPFIPGGYNPYLNYSYKLNSQRYMLETKIIYHTQSRLAYFMQLAGGFVNMHSSELSFNEDGTTVPPTSTSISNTNAAYSLAIGSSYVFDHNFQINASIKKVWMGSNEIAIDDGSGALPHQKQAALNPWQISISLGYRL